MAIQYEVIPFTYNWNNKLDCKAFSTIRLYNPNRHVVGTKFEITLKGKFISLAAIIDIKPFKLDKLNAFMSYLDTGYSVEECRKVIKTMYPKVDFEKKLLVFILLVKCQ